MKTSSFLFIISIFLLASPVYGQMLHFNYTVPVPGSSYINPEQSLILRTGTAFDGSTIGACELVIKGTQSGLHSYTWKLSEDQKTLVVVPKPYFSLGETVSVHVPEGLQSIYGEKIAGASFSFNIKDQDNLEQLKEYYKRERELELEAQKANPAEVEQPPTAVARDLNHPADYCNPVMIHYEDTDDKCFFFTLNPRAGNQNYSTYLSINDEYGLPLFFRKTTHNSLNFHKMSDGRLAYARNNYSYPEKEKYFFMDSSLVVVDSIKTGNGYNMDGHDMLLLDNGHYLLMSYDPQTVNMSQIIPGGNPNATVIGLVIQEVGPEGTVFFQWRSWDHFEITDATDDINLYASNIDYVHGNAFAFDTDGNLLLSSRHLDEITKIDFETGQVIYRFGLLSKNNQFTIYNDPMGFSHQHDVRVRPNGNITIFDNGNLHPYPFSQALEYHIDEANMTANRVWFYQEDPNVYGAATGSYRRFADGTNLIGWGATWPLAATQVNQDKSKILDVMLDGALSYRVLRASWKTNHFIAPEEEDFGNFEGCTAPKLCLLPIRNNSNHTIAITSTSQQTDLFEVMDNLPKVILAGDTIELSLSFQPENYGSFSDRLTLNYDVYTLSTAERIARQVDLIGIWDDLQPTVHILPSFGTVGVDPESAVFFQFSEPIRGAGGTEIEDSDIQSLFSFQRTNEWGEAVPFFGTISSDRQQIILYPVGILEEEQAYYVKLLPNMLEGDNGNVITNSEISVFTTGLITGQVALSQWEAYRVFPSPFTSALRVRSSKGPIGQLTMYDGSGSLVFQTLSQEKQLEIPTADFPNGLYLIKISNPDGSDTQLKVVKGG